MRVIIIVISMLKRSFYKKRRLLTYLITPIIGLLIPIIFFSNIESSSKIVVVDNNNTKTSENIISKLKEDKEVNLFEDTEINAEQLLVENKISAIVIIPEYFDIISVKNSYESINIKYLKEDEGIYRLRNKIQSILIDEVAVNNKINEGEVTTFDNKNSSVSFNNYVIYDKYIDTMCIGFISIFLTIFFTNSFSTIIKDKSQNILQRINLTTTTTIEYITGLIIWNSILAIVEIFIVMIIINIFNIDIGINTKDFIIILSAICILAMSIGLLIVSLSRNENQLSVISTLVIFPSSMLSGALWPVEIMSESLKKISYFFPQRYIFILRDSLINRNNKLAIVSIILIILISFFMIFISIIFLNNQSRDNDGNCKN